MYPLTPDDLWADISLLAASEQQQFTEVQILTLQAYIEEIAYEQALSEDSSFTKIDQRVSKIICSEISTIKEFIEINPSQIRVGINSTLVDDNAISKALFLLSKVKTFAPGTRLEFGQPIHVYDIQQTNVQ